MALRSVKPIDAVVLAGGPPDDVAAVESGAPNKAFIHIGGMTLVERTLRALRSAPSIARIIVVAPAITRTDTTLKLADERRPDGLRIRDSLANGLAGLPLGDDVLIAASDMPILTPDSIDDFVTRVHDAAADICYGCVEQTCHREQFPDVPHTWVRLREGTFCGAGLVALKPRAWPALEAFIERLGAARKNPLRLARLFGPDILLKYALRRLSIADAEERAARLLGVHARAIISPFPQIAVNVDRVSDVALARAIITRSSTDPVSPNV